MTKDRIFTGMLIIVAVLLLLNLFSHGIGSFVTSEAAAQYKSIQQQKNTFRGNGIGIACSSDGRYVYAAGSGSIFRSTDYGKPGSWEPVVQ